MKLTDLKTALDTVGSSGINQVIFEFPDDINLYTDKDYPLVYWDFRSYRSKEDMRAEQAIIRMNCYILQYYDRGANPETESKSQLEVWDELRAAFKLYLEAINAAASLTINMKEVDYELFDAGVISVDFELGVGYTIQIKTFCE